MTNRRFKARKKPCDGAERGRDRQRLELVREGVLAERTGGVLVLADGSKDPSPGGLLQHKSRIAMSRIATAHTTRNSGKMVSGSPHPRPSRPVDDRVRGVVPGLVEAEDPLVAAGQVTRVQGEEPDDLRSGDRGDRQVVGAQAHRGQAHEEPEGHGDQHRDGQREPERQSGLVTRIAIE